MRLVATAAVAAAAFALARPAFAVEDSASNRQDKHAYVAIEPIGFTLTPVEGVRAAYFVSSDFLIEASYANAKVTTGDISAKKSLSEVQAKHFLGNSFYATAGFGQERWAATYSEPEAADASLKKDLSATLTNTDFEVHIGNQWQWSGYTMGVDWLGYAAALSSKTSFASDTTVDQSQKADDESTMKKDFGGSSWHLVRFYLGWAF